MAKDPPSMLLCSFETVCAVVDSLVALTSKVRLSNEEEAILSTGFADSSFAVTDTPSMSEIILLATSMYTSCDTFDFESVITVCRKRVDQIYHLRVT